MLPMEFIDAIIFAPINTEDDNVPVVTLEDIDVPVEITDDDLDGE